MIVPDKNRTHLLRNSGLPSIAFSRTARGSPLSFGNFIGVHTRVLRSAGDGELEA